MTAFQTYAEAPSAGQAGHIASNSNGFLGRTLVRATDAAIDCALAVCNGTTAGKTVKAPTTAAEAAACLGILLDPVYLNEIGQVATSYGAAQPSTILEDGYMWVNSEGTVAVNDPVFVRILSDGGSNLTKGTLTNTSDYPAGGVVLTPSLPTQAATYFNLTLSDGTVTETFTFLSDGTPSVAEIAAGLVAQVDQSANFAATGTVTISITSTSGIVEVLQAHDCLAITTAARAHRHPGWFWSKARTGAGLTKVRSQAPR